MWFRYLFAVLFGIALSDYSECKSVVKRSQIESLIRNDAPIIGVLTQEVSAITRKNFPGDYGSYIAASYVKFLEGSGARVVPIWIGKDRRYYADIMSKINGVLMPGGATYFNNTNGYADAGVMIYEIAVEMNRKGTYMPLWGTCLGFELILYAATNRLEHRSGCNSMEQLLPLQFRRVGLSRSKLFSDAPSDIMNILSTQNITYNYHQFCTTPDRFKELNLGEDWRVLSTNVDFKGIEFISTVEHKRYPFYAVQFHPEKHSYEWAANKAIPHSPESIHVTQYFGNFFVNECRKNGNHFETELEKLDSLIQNFSPTFTGRGKSAFYQIYFFDSSPSYGNILGIASNLV